MSKNQNSLSNDSSAILIVSPLVKGLFKFSGFKNSIPFERTQIVEEDAALVGWYEDKLNVVTWSLTDCG